MIEREVENHTVNKRILMRFVFDGDDDYEAEVKWCCSYGDPPQRVWSLKGDIEFGHSFTDASWARRFSKIVELFRAYVDDPEWRTEIIEVTDEILHTVTLERLWPLNAIEMLAKVAEE